MSILNYISRDVSLAKSKRKKRSRFSYRVTIYKIYTKGKRLSRNLHSMSFETVVFGHDLEERCATT